MKMLLIILLVLGYIKIETMMEGNTEQLKELFEDENV